MTLRWFRVAMRTFPLIDLPGEEVEDFYQSMLPWQSGETLCTGGRR